jgi:hypothetical protein
MLCFKVTVELVPDMEDDLLLYLGVASEEDRCDLRQACRKFLTSGTVWISGIIVYNVDPVHIKQVVCKFHILLDQYWLCDNINKFINF